MQMAANFGPAPAPTNSLLADLPTDGLVPPCHAWVRAVRARPLAQSFINMSKEKGGGREGDEVRNTFSFLLSPPLPSKVEPSFSDPILNPLFSSHPIQFVSWALVAARKKQQQKRQGVLRVPGIVFNKIPRINGRRSLQPARESSELNWSNRLGERKEPNSNMASKEAGQYGQKRGGR